MRVLVEPSWRSVGSSTLSNSPDDPLRERLPELDAPLIEGVDLPYGALYEHAVLVEGDERPEGRGCQMLRQDHARRATTLERPVGHEPVRRPVGPDLVGRLAERERLRLHEDVRHEQVVMSAERVQGL